MELGLELGLELGFGFGFGSGFRVRVPRRTMAPTVSERHMEKTLGDLVPSCEG